MPPSKLSPGAIAGIVIGSVVGALVISALITFVCHLGGSLGIVYIGDRNLGNGIIWYASVMQDSFSRGLDLNALRFGPGKGEGNLIMALRLHKRYLGSGYRKGLCKSSWPIESRQLFDCYQVPRIWKAVQVPLSRELDYHLPPPAAGSSTTAIAHFRASDAPFDRHPEYGFMRYRWWGRMLAHLPDAGSLTRAKLYWCNQHHSLREFAAEAQEYFDDLQRYLNEHEESVRRGLTWEHHCGQTPEQDLQDMRHAAFLISPGSSFSWIAGVTGYQRATYVIQSLKAQEQGLPLASGDDLPTHVHEVERDMLSQPDVVDYHDVARVLEQLRA